MRRVTDGADAVGQALNRALRSVPVEKVPLFRQSFISVLIVSAAVLSTILPWLVVTDVVTMWLGVVVALAASAFTGLMARHAELRRWELVVPAADFVAVGLLRYGTGAERSVFLPIVLLAVIWIASWPGRRNVLLPLAGTCVTLLMPYLFDPGGRGPSELIRLAFALVVYATVAASVNELARQAKARLERARAQQHAVERELNRAAVVQQSLLPPDASTLPDAFAVFGACVPAREVGGDFFDWYPTSTGIAVTVGDVMGKGVGAGMIAAAVRSVIRSSVDDADPSEAFRRASVGLTTSAYDTETQFTTSFHARIDADGGVLWADAGHGLAFVRRASGRVDRLNSADLPIGVGTGWQGHRSQLGEGDVFVCVSDGVLDLFPVELEALNDLERLLAATPEPARIVEVVERLALERERSDDVTVVATALAPTSVPVQP
ncbi:PP2C family protein-serine/threonine phosphatase [Frigoribacterium sp. Leaf186]|uniref:PP2C family protein-serine/threonine phosphatase n=1 Tax=Frigoribacterium sp. Leaf186 TaxID=1736293 RepID=UPI0006FC2D56|nr:SpoIIE family protein phosphatase [Frigoribacterium sp. Leaf186]KQS17576.1 hypothetical protein ASG05_08995 [Frigoribacterium sp. Leaf186]